MARLSRGAAALAFVAALTACAPTEEVLPGPREDVSRADVAPVRIADAARPITLAAPTENASWTHPGGNASHRVGHVALAARPSLAWSASIGAGDSRKARINVQPVVAGNRIFTVDADGIVTATSAEGATLWTQDLTPPLETTGQGGSHGLSLGGGLLYVNTGFGRVVALDPATGDTRWTQDLDALGGGSATYFNGRLYVSARDSLGWAINAETGRVEWQINGTPSGSGYVGGAGPAVNSTLAVFPFPSGELRAVFRRGGLPRWSATVLGRRSGVAYAVVSDVSADPVIADGRLYVANPAGRIVALDLTTGNRIWTAREGALTAPVVAGGSVFIVSDQNALARLDAANGAAIWSRALPLFEEEKERRQKTVYAHHGPVLAGGLLWVASSDEVLRAFDPETGQQMQSLELPGGAAAAPAVANGTLYVVTESGRLMAFR